MVYAGVFGILTGMRIFACSMKSESGTLKPESPGY